MTRSFCRGQYSPLIAKYDPRIVPDGGARGGRVESAGRPLAQCSSSRGASVRFDPAEPSRPVLTPLDAGNSQSKGSGHGRDAGSCSSGVLHDARKSNFVFVAPNGRLSTVLGFKFMGGKIVEISVFTDPARFDELDLAVLPA